MKNIYFLSVALFMLNAAIAQSYTPCVSCLPQGIVFRLQAQIDSFAIHYPNCTEIEGYVAIGGGWQDPSDISNLNGLNVLTSIGSSLYIGSWGTYFPPNLKSLSGLDNVITIGGQLEISGSDSLTNLMGLESLTSVGGDLVIWANNALTTLAGIENMDTGSIMNLYISENSSLSHCEIESICKYLASPNGTIGIENNAAGCNSQQEVEDACASIGIESLTPIFSPSIYPNPASDKITIETITKGSISILNLNGQQLISQQITEPKTILNIEDLPRGVYFVRFSGGRTVEVRKIIKW